MTNRNPAFGPPDSRDQIEWVREHAIRVFGHEPSLDEAFAFISGMDLGQNFGLLRGFESWLTVRLGFGYEFHWRGLVPELLERDTSEQPTGAPASHRFLDLVLSFLDDCASDDALRETYRDFEALRQTDGLA